MNKANFIPYALRRPNLHRPFAQHHKFRITPPTYLQSRPPPTSTMATSALPVHSPPLDTSAQNPIRRPASDSTTSHHQPPTAWSSPGPAAFDFRSDVVTTPTPSMLAAIINTTLLDDVFRSDPTTNELESYIATLTGHESALLALSGTMANQLALRSHLQGPPHSVLTDHRAHILEWEAGGVASLCGALVKGIVPRNGHMLSLEDIIAHAVVADDETGTVDVHACPTRVVSLENTLGGEILPLLEAQKIKAWAHSHDIRVHCDGARLWEAVAAQVSAGMHNGDLETGLKAYSACFDSVSLCFSKGLGAPIGSILIGSAAFIQRARHVRKSIGGGLRQAGVVTAAARVAVSETFLGGRLEGSHRRAGELSRLWVGKGGRLAKRTETNMLWLDLAAAGCSARRFRDVGARHGVQVGIAGGRLVVHYQISDEAVRRLSLVMDEILVPETADSLDMGHTATVVETTSADARAALKGESINGIVGTAETVVNGGVHAGIVREVETI